MTIDNKTTALITTTVTELMINQNISAIFALCLFFCSYADASFSLFLFPITGSLDYKALYMSVELSTKFSILFTATPINACATA